jgi:pimeloyl-ACP methyl ester carboxylesterase
MGEGGQGDRLEGQLAVKDTTMKIIITCALITMSLSACILEGFRGQASNNTDHLIQVGDIKMGYRIYGNGYPLVMIMGYGNTMKLWEPMLIRSLSLYYKLIIFDNRGMGNTETGQRPFSIEQFADDTAGLMDALDIRQAHVLGWSMGALIAEEVALRHPSKVNKLILYAAHCNANLFPPTPEVIQKLTDMSGSPKEQGIRFISTLFPPDWLRSSQERIKEIFYRPLGNIPPETMNKQSMAIGKWKGCCDRLGEISKPTLVIAGTDDVLVPPQNARYLVGKIPNSQLVLYEQGGHGLMFQYPEKFSEKVIGFLR